MKTRQTFWGVFLISIGALILLRNYINIDIEWDDIWKLWPLILVLIGINLIVKNNAAKVVLSGLTALLLAFALYLSFASFFGLIRHNHYRIQLDEEGDYEVSNYTAGFEKGIKKAYLEVDAGAGTFELSDTTFQLFDAIVEGKSNTYSLTSHIDEGTADLLFKMKQKRFYLKQKNRVEFKLNPIPEWNMKFDIGAADVNFDLSKYITDTIDIQMGAASLQLKLGDLAKENHVNIDAGASSINIEIPEEAGCEIVTKVSLSSRNFEGFNKIKEDVYRTENFDSAQKKIYIDLESGISSINVERTTW